MQNDNFRYDCSGAWFKGNTHLHSVSSDGGKDFQELAELYAGAGYDFLFRTDHWVCSDVESDSQNYPLLWIDGVELDGRDSSDAYYHIVCLGKVNNLSKEDDFNSCIESAKKQGAMLILAHPHWSGNTLNDCEKIPFDGVEIYNHVCHWLNGKSNGLVHWERALNNNPTTLGLAVDDAHLRAEHPVWNGGWIMVNADECSRDSVLKSIRSGNFYSSCGPEINSISYDGQNITIDTTPIQYARLVGPGPRGVRTGSFEGARFTQTSLKAPADWKYVYLEIEDINGRRAWSNNLFHCPDFNLFDI